MAGLTRNHRTRNGIGATYTTGVLSKVQTRRLERPRRSMRFGRKLSAVTSPHPPADSSVPLLATARLCFHHVRPCFPGSPPFPKPPRGPFRPVPSRSAPPKGRWGACDHVIKSAAVDRVKEKKRRQECPILLKRTYVLRITCFVFSSIPRRIFIVLLFFLGNLQSHLRAYSRGLPLHPRDQVTMHKYYKYTYV